MADLPANNATFASVLAASAGGDTILLADEIYDDFTRTTAITRSPRVTIKPANKNGVRFKSVNANNAMFQIQGWNGFNIEGLIFDGTDLSYTGTDGKKYPNGGTRAVKSHHCSNITWRDILIDFLDIGIETGSGGASSTYNNNIVHEYCELTRMGMDGLRVYNATNGYTIRKCYLHNFNVNRTIDPATGKGRHYAGGRHVDGSQGAVQNQDPPSRNLVIEDNYCALLTGSDGYSHGIFYLNDRTNKQGATTGDIFYENMSIQRNYVETGHTNAIAFSGARGTLICRDNCCRTPANGYDSLPTINIYRLVGTSASKLQLANNVRGRDLGKGTNGTLDQNNLQYVQVSVAEPDIVSTSPTTFPVGWNTLGPVVPGGALTARTVGRYAYEFGGPPTEVQPTTPTVIGSPGTATGHGRVEPYYSAGLIDWTGNGTLVQAYSGVLVIPPTSPAWTAASGAPANLDVQWKRTSHTNWRNCRIATPPTNAATSMRFEMLPSLSAYNAAFPDAHRDHAVQAGGSMADVEWRYKPKTGTLWSEKSTYVSGFTAPAAVTPCSVTSAIISNTAFIAGQTATANFDYTLGSGTFTSLKVDWLVNGVIVETDSGLANGTKTATYVCDDGTGQLTYQVTLATSVNSATLTTPVPATIGAALVLPSFTADDLDKGAYTLGDVAVYTFDYNLGNGSFTSLRVEWRRDGALVETDNLANGVKTASYATAAAGILQATAFLTTSAGTASVADTAPVASPAPNAPDADDWAFVAVVPAAGFTDRFTAQLQFPIGTNVTESAVIGVGWTADGGTTWRNCINRGISGGRTLWELGPSAAIGDQAHTVGFDGVSSGIRIRISTATGTSPASPAPGQAFTGPPAPPIEEDDEPAAADADWLLEITPAPGLAGYFTGLIQFAPTGAIDDGDIVTLEWAGLDGAWRPTMFVGLDDGERTWRLLPLIGGGTEHLVTYGLTLSNVRIRYSTATGISPASTGTKQVTAPMAPPPVDGPDPDEILMSGASPMVCAGLPVKIAGDIRPGTPPEEILPVIIEGVISIVLPSLPTTAVQFIVSYAGRQAAHTENETWAAAIVPGHWGGLITAFDAQGRPGVSAIFFVEAP